MKEIFQRFFPYKEDYTDYLNPVLLRNLRQTILSKAFWIVLFLLLGCNVIIVLASFSGPTSTYGPSLGKRNFLLFYVLLNLICFLGIPYYLGNQFRMESLLKLDELIRIATLSPSRIVLGFVLSGIIIEFLVYSVTAPFILYSYLLKGIDQVTIAFGLSITFLLTPLYLCFTMTLVGANKKDRGKMGMLGLVILGGFWITFTLAFFVSYEMKWYIAAFWKPMSLFMTGFIFLFYLGRVFLWFSSAASALIEEDGDQVSNIRLAYLMNIGLMIFLYMGSYVYYKFWLKVSHSTFISFTEGITGFISIFLNIFLVIAALFFITEKNGVTIRQETSFYKWPKWKKWGIYFVLPGAERGALVLVLTAFLELGLLSMQDNNLKVLFIFWGYTLFYTALPVLLIKRMLGAKYNPPLCRKIIVFFNVVWHILTAILFSMNCSYDYIGIFGFIKGFVSASYYYRFKDVVTLPIILGSITLVLFIPSAIAGFRQAYQIRNRDRKRLQKKEKDKKWKSALEVFGPSEEEKDQQEESWESGLEPEV
ncbi:MAG: hypothetical protein D6785_10065 [Planctomycetota bacterium]|nr:MAG: hypothetical protein D6785_10065 [Planctomycetota bacterium]